jgi:hypothetical protein
MPVSGGVFVVGSCNNRKECDTTVREFLRPGLALNVTRHHDMDEHYLPRILTHMSKVGWSGHR